MVVHPYQSEIDIYEKYSLYPRLSGSKFNVQG